MKRFFSILLLSVYFSFTFAQIESGTKVDDKQLVFNFKLADKDNFIIDNERDYYVVEMPGKTAHQLFMNILENVASVYNNPKEVLSTVEDRSIVVNGFVKDITEWKVVEKRFTLRFKVSLNYKLSFQVKENKIRVNAPIINIIREMDMSNFKIRDITPGYYFNYVKIHTPSTISDIENTFNSIISVLVYGSSEGSDDW